MILAADTAPSATHQYPALPLEEQGCLQDSADVTDRHDVSWQIILTLGIVVAQAINLGTQHIAGWGWRVSLGCAGIPAVVLTAGGLLLPDTPNSLIDRGHEEEGKQVCPHGLESIKKPILTPCFHL